MNRAIRKLSGRLTFAIPFAIVMIMTMAGPHANGEDQKGARSHQSAADSAKLWWLTDPIEGVWNVSVTITDCDSGNPLGPRFDAMAMFGGDGTFHDTNSNNPITMGRSDGFGYWKHVRGNKYRFAFKLFHFDMAGMYFGYDVVRHDVVLARNGKSYQSKGTAEFFNPDGTKRPPVLGCSESTATRFR